jgi:RHS repeat-associated protein
LQKFSYNAAGQRTATSVFAGTNKVYDTLYQYDGMGRLTDLTHQNGETIFADYDYGWDAANRITDFDFTFLSEKNEKTSDYGYDKTSQLVSADYNSFQNNELYRYDANGNRISEKFKISANNQLTSDGDFCYTYDDEGNRIKKKSLKFNETVKYEWDHRNRLVKVTTHKETVRYVYDYRNRMVKRNDEFVVHDGYQIVLTLDNKGSVKTRNLWGANVDELIATNNQFTLCDHLNSVRDAIDAKGKVIGHREYNAFGKVTRSTGKVECIFGYTGKIFDNQTQLQWNINRWYDANVGRWISEDPIGFKGRDTNLYRFVMNKPIVIIDRIGLKWGNAMFIYHYYFGGGVAVSLTTAGLHDDLLASARVQEITEDYMDKCKTQLYSQANVCSSGTTTIEEEKEKWIDVTEDILDLFSNPINRPNTIQKTVILYSPVLPKQPDVKLEKRSICFG